ncbi:MAG: 4-hydroxy-tetrahydrodipicolinate reductase [Candidatus Omnitrophica bacterium]|nr:4-hydroxy-tetrahydrodipicolinate reductase [Candidatus Omnitrophota bacterium]
MIRVGIYGCCGKMGKRLAALTAADAQCKLTVLVERAGHPEIGQTMHGVQVSDSLDAIAPADVVIDFTVPQASLQLLPAALRHKKALVIGTTGMDAAQQEQVKQAARAIPIVFSPNMSVGVNVLFALIKDAAAKLNDYRVSIVEYHHIHKKDAPSGTAKQIAAIIEAQTGKAVTDIKAIREGEIVGDHDIRFESDVDVLEIRHSAKTRDIFAQGGVAAARWIFGKPAGLYSTKDVLGL